MMKVSFLAILSLLIYAAFASAQDPGMPDSVIAGNLDGSPMYVDSSANVDVWIKNDENKETCYFLIGIEQRIGHLDHQLYFEPLTSWDIIIDSSGVELPDYPDFTFFRTVCYCQSDPGCQNPLNTDSTWQKIMAIHANFYPDSLIPGDTSCLMAIWQGISSVQAGCFIFESPQKINENEKPCGFGFMHIYPNPFNARTMIEYVLTEPSAVTIQIYDLTGRRINMLIDETQLAGAHQIVWDGSARSSGIYFCKIDAGGYSETQRMVLLK